MGQPRREKPPLVMGMPGGRRDWEASLWLGAYRRLGSAKVEAKRGPVRLNYVQCCRKTLRRAHKGAIIEVPSVQGEGGYLSLDTLDDGV